MASSTGTKISQLIVGGLAISALGLSTIQAIRSGLSAAALQRAAVLTGDTYLLTSEDSTPSVYLNNESPAIETYPTSLGVEHCYGNTGALLCEIAIKLTGSGGHRAHNAGSWVCTSATCSILESEVYTEAVPRSDRLYLGWTTSPNSASGAQLMSNELAASGATLIGSGALVTGQNDKAVPPGATVKAVWTLGNDSEDYSRTKALWVTRYRKYYTP